MTYCNTIVGCNGEVESVRAAVVFGINWPLSLVICFIVGNSRLAVIGKVHMHLGTESVF